MAAVTDLDAARAQRDLARAVEVARSGHPSLRWIAGDVWFLAHRRDVDTGMAACGASGELMRAAATVPLCGRCYSRGERP